MSVRVVVSSTDSERARQVGAVARSAAALDVVADVDLADLGDVMASAHPDVLVIDGGLDTGAALAQARLLTLEHGDLRVVLLADPDDAVLREPSRPAGVAQVVALPADPAAIAQAVESAWADGRDAPAAAPPDDPVAPRSALDTGPPPRPTSPSGPDPGRVLVVAGAKGGVGCSTVAAQLALIAQQGEGVDVVLVDLDLQTGDLRALLDVAHGQTIADLARPPEPGSTPSSPGERLAAALHRHSSGLQVLLGPKYGELADGVDGGTVRQVVATLSGLGHLVIVDAGAVATEANTAATQMADDVVVVMTPDVPALRGANRLLGLWDRLGVRSGGIRVLVNRFARSAEVQPEVIRRVVEADVLDTMIPADFSALDSAVNSGVPGPVGRGRLRTSLLALADELAIAGVPAAPAPRRRLWG